MIGLKQALWPFGPRLEMEASMALYCSLKY